MPGVTVNSKHPDVEHSLFIPALPSFYFYASIYRLIAVERTFDNYGTFVLWLSNERFIIVKRYAGMLS